MKAGKAGQNLIIRDQIAAFENLWGATVCCIVQKKLLFVCERKMLLCKVQNSIASRRLHYTIYLLLSSIFGMKSTFRLKKDFYLVLFFCLEEKKMLEKTHMQKKEPVVWRSWRISFLKRERLITQTKIGTFFLAKKNQKDKNVKTILFRP